MPASKFLNPRIAVYALILVAATYAWHFHRLGANSTPREALDSLIHALKSRDEPTIRALTTKRGFTDLWNAASGYTGKGPALGQVLETEVGIIRRDNSWQSDETHASGGVRWTGGSGNSTADIELVQTNDGWKLDRYLRTYIDGPGPMMQ